MLKVKNELSLQIPVHSYHKDIRKFRTRSLVVDFEQVLPSPQKTSTFLLQPLSLISRLY